MGIFFRIFFWNQHTYSGTNELIARFRRLSIFLCSCLCLHVYLMMAFERLSLIDAIWFTLTTAFTVGYGDIVVHTPEGKIATVLLVYFGCILTLGKAASDWFEFRSLKKEKILTGKWGHKMEGHIIIFGSPKHGFVEFFDGLKRELLLNFADKTPPCVVVTPTWGNKIPEKLHALEYRYINYSQFDPVALTKVSLDNASYVIVLVESFIPNDLDYANMELVSHIRELGFKGPLVAEVTHDQHKERMRKAGANSVLRAIRSHPEVLIKTLLFPGTEEILDNLFTCRADNLVRKDLAFKGSWEELVLLCLKKHAGLPISVLNQDGKIITNPINEKYMDIKAVYLLIKENEHLVKRGLKLHSDFLKRSA